MIEAVPFRPDPVAEREHATSLEVAITELLELLAARYQYKSMIMASGTKALRNISGTNPRVV